MLYLGKLMFLSMPKRGIFCKFLSSRFSLTMYFSGFFFSAVIEFAVDYKGKIEAGSAHLPRFASHKQFIIRKAHLFLNYVVSGRLSSLQ